MKYIISLPPANKASRAVVAGLMLAACAASIADASASCNVIRYSLNGVHLGPNTSFCGAAEQGAAGASSVTTTIPGQTTTITASAKGAPVITFDSDYPGALPALPPGNSSACYDTPWYITNLYANGVVIHTDTNSAQTKPLDTTAAANYSFAWTSSWDALGAYSYSAGAWSWYTPTSAVVWDPNTAQLTGDPTGGQLANRVASNTYYVPLFCGTANTSITLTVTDKTTGLSGSLTLTKAIGP
jgi:hypothetical protein